MNQARWLACEDPGPMLAALRGGASERKLRLFACACCRRLWHLLVSNPARQAVEVTERYADGRADEAEMAIASAALVHLRRPPGAGPRDFFAHAAVSYLFAAAEGGAASCAAAVASWASGA